MGGRQHNDHKTADERLSPEAKRRRTLREYGLDEGWLTGLKDLPPDEAEWRIRHEHKSYVAFSKERMEWCLEDCVRNRPEEPKPPVLGRDDVVFIGPRSGPSGSLVG
jgi:hypothetical protein